MIIVDANLLIYAVNQDAPQHDKARRWWEGALSGEETVGLAWVVILAFLRLTTRRGIMTNPLSAGAATHYISEWLQRPVVEQIVPGKAHWRILHGLLLTAGALGDLTTDAHLAAMAQEHGATIYSADRDFQHFKAIKYRNPLLP